MSMRSRRFTILAAVLVTLNLALWLVPQGQALRGAVIAQLFGPRLIRAEVVVQGTTTGTTDDYLIDRGVIVAITPGGITLKEADGRLQPISVATGTRVTGLRRAVDVAALRTNLRVLVFRQANGPAETIQVEGRGALP
jgi:hypothetical protein